MLENSSERPRPFADAPWRLRDVVQFVLLWLGGQVILGLVLTFQPLWPQLSRYIAQSANGQNIVASLVVSIVSFVLGFGVLAWMLRQRHAGWGSLGWRRFSLIKAIGLVVVLLIAFLVLIWITFVLVTVLVPGFDANQAQTNDFTNPRSRQEWWVSLMALVVLPPVIEETIFRGLAFAAFSKRWGYIWGAVLSSVLFALLHGQANVGVYTFVLGLMLCVVYVKFKSIGPGILLHMANNLLAFLAIGANAQ